MNCKQGDLAIVVGGKRNQGKIVRCLQIWTDPHRDSDGRVFRSPAQIPRWVTDPPLRSVYANSGRPTHLCTIADVYLRPLRGDLEDETTDTRSPTIIKDLVEVLGIPSASSKE